MPNSPLHSPIAAISHEIFYSISTAGAGLRGISFGNFLIKQIAIDKAETPSLEVCATLSPEPGSAAGSTPTATARTAIPSAPSIFPTAPGSNGSTSLPIWPTKGESKAARDGSITAICPKRSRRKEKRSPHLRAVHA
jgi:hypothetical protein